MLKIKNQIYIQTPPLPRYYKSLRRLPTFPLLSPSLFFNVNFKIFQFLSLTLTRIPNPPQRPRSPASRVDPNDGAPPRTLQSASLDHQVLSPRVSSLDNPLLYYICNNPWKYKKQSQQQNQQRLLKYQKIDFIIIYNNKLNGQWWRTIIVTVGMVTPWLVSDHISSMNTHLVEYQQFLN